MSRYRPFGTGQFVGGPDDYWRVSFGRRITPIVGNPNLSATLVHEDGCIKQFDAAGVEILNVTGAADRLQNLGAAGWRITTAGHDVEQYDTQGRLTSVTTRGGLATNIGYDGTGRMSTISNSFGRQLVLGYNANNQMASVTLPGATTIQYAYDTVGRLTTVTYPDTRTKTYHYEDRRNQFFLTGITDESNTRFSTYRYDDRGRSVSSEHAGGVNKYQFIGGYPINNGQTSATVIDPVGKERSYALFVSKGVYRQASSTAYEAGQEGLNNATFDANGNHASKTSLNNWRTNYVHDLTRNLETSRTEGLNGLAANVRTITTQWHPTYRLPTQEEVYAGSTATGTPLRRTTMTYDSSGNQLTRTVTDPALGLSRTWTQTYNAFGQVLTIDGPRTDVADVTAYTYYNCTSGAQCGQLATVVNASGHLTTYNTYNAHGQPTRVTDANNVVTTLAYDARQRLTDRCVNGLLPACTGGELTRMEYWPTGRIKKVTSPDGSYLQYTYDGAQRLTQIEDALGNKTSYVLDGAGNRQAENSYDPFGALTQSRTRLYNSLGQLWQILTTAGTDTTTTVLNYDLLGNQTTTTAPLGRVTVNAYDELNRLKQITDPAGGLTKMSYDANDNLLQVTDPRNIATTYEYTGLGDMKRLTSPDTGVTNNTFDSGGNVLTSTNANNAVMTNTFDALGRPLTTSYKVGTVTDQSLSYTYDAGTNGKGRLTSVSDASHSLSWTYDALGRVASKTQVIGTLSRSVGYGYTTGRLASMTTPSGQAIAYGYNAAGQVTGITVNGITLLSNVLYEPFGPVAGWTWGNNSLAVREYDLDGRLTTIDSAGLSSYSYDDAGQIQSRIDDALNSYMLTAGTTATTVSTSSNRLNSTTGTLARTYSHDAAGNTIGYGAVTFTYNYANRMKTSSNGGLTTTYLYNALGQRVRKSSSAGTTVFVYDEAGQLVGEYGATGALVQETVWLGNIPVATLRPKAGGGVDLFYVHTDHLNTPRRVSKPAGNTIVWRWDSDPFGEAPANSDPDGDATQFVYNLRFPGQYADQETGLHYNYFRDYDSAIGRYVQSDPIGLSGGSFSTYAYVNGNPVSLVDPRGLRVEGHWIQKPFPTVYDAHVPVGRGNARRPDNWWQIWQHGGSYGSMEHLVNVTAGFDWKIGCRDTETCESWEIGDQHRQVFDIWVPIRTPAVPRIGFYLSLANISWNLLIQPATEIARHNVAGQVESFLKLRPDVLCNTMPRQ
jgi:RHS repeat-associated protein